MQKHPCQHDHSPTSDQTFTLNILWIYLGVRWTLAIGGEDETGPAVRSHQNQTQFQHSGLGALCEVAIFDLGFRGAQSALDQTRSDINTATLVDTRAVRHCHCLVFPLCSWLRQCLCLAVTSFWTGLDSTVGPAVGGVDVLLRPRVAVFFSWALASRDAPGPFVRGTS